MLLPHSVARILSAGMIFLATGVVSGQPFPNKPLRIVTTEPAGSADLVARLIALGLSGGSGQQAIIDNRGGSLAVPSEIVAKATPDGHTLLVIGSGLWISPLILGKQIYDPVKDFSPITVATSSPTILVVHPSVPASSVKDLITYGKSRPGELNYASGPAGASSHLAAELFKAMAGLNMVCIFYKGGNPALNDVIAGRVQLMFPSAAAARTHLQSGRLKALAVTSPQPSALVPGLPTVASTGLPGYQSVSVYGVLAPAATPAALINRLHQEIVRVLNNQEIKEKLASAGLEVIGSSPQEFATAMKSDMTRMGNVIKDAGIRAD